MELLLRVQSRHTFRYIVVRIDTRARYAHDLLERIPEAAPGACADEDGAPCDGIARVPHTPTSYTPGMTPRLDA